MKVLKQFFSEQPAGLGELLPRDLETDIHRRDFIGFKHQAGLDFLGCQRRSDPKGHYRWPTEFAGRGNDHRSDEQVGKLYYHDGRPWLYVLTNIAGGWASELPMPVTDLNFR
ncbi:hypothetical protein [Agrobacterium tumefaciens]|uniref:hypothetical protein n=1 Tax=Agrobacterium tumefaciens TaxID=358 RepID=UPI002AFE02D0|nr:hypothetical protein [Agrobacterium tumefaciens]